jgi:hypothetical protein
MNEKQLIHELYVELTVRGTIYEEYKTIDPEWGACDKHLLEVFSDFKKMKDNIIEIMKKSGACDNYSYILCQEALNILKIMLAWDTSYQFSWRLLELALSTHLKNELDVAEELTAFDYEDSLGYKESLKKEHYAEATEKIKMLIQKCKEAIILADQIDNGTIKELGERLEEFAKNNPVENSPVKEVN